MVHSPLFFFARGAAVLFLQAAFAFREVHSTRRENINNPGAVPEGKAVDGRSPLDAHQCSFVRTMPPTNGTDHRILSVPREVWINAKEPHASLFARKLCCVYTHLQKVFFFSLINSLGASRAIIVVHHELSAVSRVVFRGMMIF